MTDGNDPQDSRGLEPLDVATFYQITGVSPVTHAGCPMFAPAYMGSLGGAKPIKALAFAFAPEFCSCFQ